MGRKTHESIGRVLPNRTNIIITRDVNYQVDEALVVHSLKEALTKAESEPGGEEIFVIGGGQIYSEALPLVDRLYITVIDHEYEGDTYFPDYSDFAKVLEEKEFEENGIKYKTQILEH
jgi:dihydrofolate reductase